MTTNKWSKSIYFIQSIHWCAFHNHARTPARGMLRVFFLKKKPRLAKLSEASFKPPQGAKTWYSSNYQDNYSIYVRNVKASKI